MRAPSLVLAALCVASMVRSVQAEELRILAAGSLREVIGELGNHYRDATKVEIIADFGPSGVLRERIKKVKKPISSPRPTWVIRSNC
jgi:molybdate transport system substrate-binding protein